MSEENTSLLNVFEVDEEFGTRYLICFLDPDIAAATGIDGRAVVGEFTPDKDGEFDPGTFELNPDFIATFSEYMNTEAIHSPDLLAQAKADPGGWLYLVDPRHPFDRESEEPSPDDIIGRFLVNDDGSIAPNTFQYNGGHVLFDRETGVSGMLSDRKFYDWLNARSAERGSQEEAS